MEQGIDQGIHPIFHQNIHLLLFVCSCHGIRAHSLEFHLLIARRSQHLGISDHLPDDLAPNHGVQAAVINRGPLGIIISLYEINPDLVAWIFYVFWRFFQIFWWLNGRPSDRFICSSNFLNGFHQNRIKLWTHFVSQKFLFQKEDNLSLHLSKNSDLDCDQKVGPTCPSQPHLQGHWANFCNFLQSGCILVTNLVVPSSHHQQYLFLSRTQCSVLEHFTYSLNFIQP